MGTGALFKTGNPFSDFIISLLARWFIPAKLDKIKLRAGEKVLLVTNESRWKNVYKKTILVFFQVLLPSVGLAVAIDTLVVFYLLVTNVRQIVNGTFGLPVPILIMVGLVCVGVIEIPVCAYRYHMEELSRQLLKIIVTNRQILVWVTKIPWGYALSSETPLDQVKDVTSGGVGNIKPVTNKKKDESVPWFEEFWAGQAYRHTQGRTVNLPSQLLDASDSIQVDNAYAGLMDVLARLVAEAKKYEALKRDSQEMMARSQIAEHLTDQGVEFESHTTRAADPMQLARALELLLNPEGLPERYIDALTLEDPGLCNLDDGTVNLDAIRGMKSAATGAAAAPGIGFKRVPRPGATV